jgi:hypothetical protein
VKKLFESHLDVIWCVLSDVSKAGNVSIFMVKQPKKETDLNLQTEIEYG